MDFDKEVITKSKNVPVVVDFWAPWCGPCQFLGPIIEELAGEANGAWELVKVNSDENQHLSAAYGIKGIPAVKMFHKGEVVAEFTGALPKHEIQKWLDQYLPSEEKELLSQIEQKLIAGDENALGELEGFIIDYPASDEARMLMARSIVLQDPSTSREVLLKVVNRNKFFEEIQQIEEMSQFLETDVSMESAVGKKLGAAQEAFKNDDPENGISLLIEAVMTDKTFMDELPRRAAVAFFQLVGTQNELTKKYRRKFDMALY
ncbi:thioredoxin [uncultured Imperialibacter sp.]|uniref:thioredoxin n=1 Tax=uncultured Imperialibacter sp. TaxID=1672639 RepID=UPI0030DD9468|tara:strand:- start:3470 stop:4252 length:783 start_codon:yes stop_codon:yes gene_type:complete